MSDSPLRIPDSPLEACEMTMKVLTFTMNKRELIKEEKYEDLWQHILIVLDICYINHTEVYNIFLDKCPHLLESECERKWEPTLFWHANFPNIQIDNSQIQVRRVTAGIRDCPNSRVSQSWRQTYQNSEFIQMKRRMKHCIGCWNHQPSPTMWPRLCRSFETVYNRSGRI